MFPTQLSPTCLLQQPIDWLLDLLGGFIHLAAESLLYLIPWQTLKDSDCHSSQHSTSFLCVWRQVLLPFNNIFYAVKVLVFKKMHFKSISYCYWRKNNKPISVNLWISLSLKDVKTWFFCFHIYLHFFFLPFFNEETWIGWGPSIVQSLFMSRTGLSSWAHLLSWKLFLARQSCRRQAGLWQGSDFFSITLSGVLPSEITSNNNYRYHKKFSTSIQICFIVAVHSMMFFKRLEWRCKFS